MRPLSTLTGTLLGQLADQVGIATGPGKYDVQAPFSPGFAFPEYPFADAGVMSGANDVYTAVRNAMGLLGLDAVHWNTDQWNPLGAFIKPGETVVLKPNFVREFRKTRQGDGDCIITHGAVIRAIADYAYIALGGAGRLIIADAPQNDANFTAIRRIARLDALQEFYRQTAGFELEVYDLRPEIALKVDGVIVGHEPLPGDPAGYVKVNLGLHSAFVEINHLCRLLYGSEYDVSELHAHQHDELHEYQVSKTILDADCVISVPKLKTHKKVGLTVNLKNLVGINGNKNWLPHYREGTPSQGGDQFADDTAVHRWERLATSGFKRLFPILGPLRSALAGPIKTVGKGVFGDTDIDVVRSGNWYGNDTTWRMVLDLNRVLHYVDSDGRLGDRPVRRFFSVVDGIVGGEGNGPLDPIPKPCGLILAGANPVAVDLVCARLMGFDHRNIPMLVHAMLGHPLALVPFTYDQITCRSDASCYAGPLIDLKRSLGFEPHFGWRGRIELLDQMHETGAVT